MKKALALVFLLVASVGSAQTTPTQNIFLFNADPWTCNAAQEGSIYGNIVSHVLRYCNGSAWVNYAVGSSISGTANTVAKFTGASSIGNSTITDDGTVVTVNTRSQLWSAVSSNNTQNFLRITGTLPDNTGTTPATGASGVVLDLTSAATSANNGSQRGLDVRFAANYVGSGPSFGMKSVDLVESVPVSQTIGEFGDHGVVGQSGLNSGGVKRVGVAGVVVTPNAAGLIIGVEGSTGGSTLGVGTSTNAIGGLFGAASGTNNVGVYAGLKGYGGTYPSFTSAALIVDNDVVAAPILIWRDNGTVKGLADDGGALYSFNALVANTTTLTTTLATSGSGSGAVVTNTGDADGSTVTILNDPTGGGVWEEAVTVAQTVTWQPSAGETLYLGSSTCTTITSSTIGTVVRYRVAAGGSGGAIFGSLLSGSATCSP